MHAISHTTPRLHDPYAKPKTPNPRLITPKVQAEAWRPPPHIIESSTVFSNIEVGKHRSLHLSLPSPKIYTSLNEEKVAVMSVPYAIEPLTDLRGPKASERIPIIARPFVSERAKKTLDIVRNDKRSNCNAPIKR